MAKFSFDVIFELLREGREDKKLGKPIGLKL